MQSDVNRQAWMTAACHPEVLVNGEASDRLSSLDRGLLYGDGVFETIAVQHGQLRFWRRHYARFAAGCARLGIPRQSEERLLQEAGALVADADRGVLKLIVTRGCGGRGYRPGIATRPTRILQLHPWPDYPEHCQASGVRVRLCRLRLGHSPALAGIKHLNRLEQVLARAEWNDPDVMEGLLLDTDGRLVEGTMSNVFLIRNGVLTTPALERCGVAGVLRTVVLELAADLALPVRVQALELEDLRAADEVFLTNCLIGIWPVVAVDDQTWPRGILTRRLQERLLNLRADGEAWLN